MALAACGGGEHDKNETPTALASRERAAAFVPGTPIPSDANVKGMWSPVYDWPLVAVHSVLMPDGRVMTYGSNTAGQQTGYFNYDIWDSSGAPDTRHMALPNNSGTDIFCSSQLLLPQTGNVFIAGGDNWTGSTTGQLTTNTGNNDSSLFNGSTNTLAKGPNLFRARWYSSSTTLISGETYIQGGNGGADRPEIRGLNGSFRLLGGADTSGLQALYPRNYVAPDGRLFGFDINGSMYYIDTSGSGGVTRAGTLALNNVGPTSSSAMFRPGRILQFGGNSNLASVIDINGPTPVVTATQVMSSQRQWVNATLLPDGKVLATSGSAVSNVATGINNIAEIWDPQTGQWLQGAVAAKARMYHSNALLLPDGGVLVSGGGAPAPSPEYNNLNAEIYYPPYLFTADGQRAARPVISAAPDYLDIGQSFAVDMAGSASVSRVTLVKTGSDTHSFNMDQRFVELTYKANGSHLAVQAPTRAGEATPGYYMLFLFNEAGVPSVAKMMRIGIAANPNPAITPTLATPAPQSATVGTAAALTLSASDPNGDTLSYNASGLPPGLQLDAQTGTISGTPTIAGSYSVAVTVSDGINAVGASFVWTITGPVPVTLDQPVAPPPVLANGSTSYTVSATGADLQYQWSFGDGTPDSGWSASPTVSHAYAAAGSYTVTISVMDSSGTLRSRSFQQTVYLPPTANRPTASSNLLYETPAGGPARVWVVNQDNDTVRGFDTATGTTLGVATVGTAPRSLARAASGLIWVTNKQSATISIFDPNTLVVTRTLALPRGSQPFGIAMSPDGRSAYVALEATGRLLKFDAASYGQLASVAVGPNVRHVSVDASGTRAYVSRFITPPLPGEGTVSVSTPATAGGEVVVVDTAAMTVAKTIVLAHSDKADGETQGRGIPNYLGAVAISPDGTQAWVPSKQDNIKRGALRDGNALNFQNTVRAISSRIVLATGQEDLGRRVDHDNSSVASAAVYDPLGALLFVALETSREVAVIDAYSGAQRLRIAVGRAPQGLAVSADGSTLYVNNFMDRTVGVYDLRPLRSGELSTPLLATWTAVSSEKLAPAVLAGKQLFYDARDTRLARDSYMSCASCHDDGGRDGRVWDFGSLGEGLRNTIALRGRAGMGQGLLHWSANFDEVQDFEGQIRSLAGGTGLMSDAAYATGTRSQPLGDKKAGLSTDLDALAAYLGSLNSFAPSPYRSDNGTPAGALTSTAVAGQAVFQSQNCAACHGGTAFTNSGSMAPVDIGTLKASSGQRLFGPLPGIDIPTLRDVWATAPYLHDGSAPTLEAAISAHKGVALAAGDLASLAEYLREVGSDEASAPVRVTAGFTGTYFNNASLSGNPVAIRVEAVNFNWGAASPPGVTGDSFSARWTGMLTAPVAGYYVFQTVSDDGVRLITDGNLIINNWTNHGPTVNNSGNIRIAAGTRFPVKLEYYDAGGGATMQLLWKIPGSSSFVPIPAQAMSPN